MPGELFLSRDRGDHFRLVHNAPTGCDRSWGDRGIRFSCARVSRRDMHGPGTRASDAQGPLAGKRSPDDRQRDGAWHGGQEVTVYPRDCHPLPNEPKYDIRRVKDANNAVMNIIHLFLILSIISFFAMIIIGFFRNKLKISDILTPP